MTHATLQRFIFLSSLISQSAFAVFYRMFLLSWAVSFICLPCRRVCEDNVEPHDPSHPIMVSLVPYERKTYCHSEGQPGISYPRVRQDLAWRRLYKWCMGYCFVFIHLFLCLYNFCIVSTSTHLVCRLLLSLTDLDWDLFHHVCLLISVSFPLFFCSSTFKISGSKLT